MQNSNECSRLLAVIINIFIPGLGQAVRGEIGRGFLWFVLTVIGYFFLIIPGLVIHFFCILNVAMDD